MPEALLTWDNRERATAPDGTTYVLGSEDFLGAHGGRIWHVYFYADRGQGATEVFSTESGSKRDARRAAENHARKRAVKAARHG